MTPQHKVDYISNIGRSYQRNIYERNEEFLRTSRYLPLPIDDVIDESKIMQIP